MKTIPFHRPDGRQLNIEVIRYEPEDVSRNKTPDRHRHDFHSIFFIQKGHSWQEVDFIDYELTKQEVMLIPKWAIHWEKESVGLAGYTILFKDEFFSPAQQILLNGLLQYAVVMRKLLIHIDDDDMSLIKMYFELLMKEQGCQPSQNQTFILQNLMLALLNKFEDLLQAKSDIPSFISHRHPFQRFTQLVEETYTQHNNLDFYASQLGFTPRKLNAVIKEITGQTASHLIIDRIILEAKRELSFSEKTVKEIAFGLGYETQQYFSRIFKKRTGTSPEAFRLLYAQ